MEAVRIKRTIIEKECRCEIKYYVWANPLTDPHFRPEDPFIVEDKYFDTKEEAENFKAELEKTSAWVTYEVCEKIVKWLE